MGALVLLPLHPQTPTCQHGPRWYPAYLLSFSQVPDENMLTGWHCHVAAFFPTKCHKDNIAFLAANEAKDRTGNIAKVLLGEPHVRSSETTGEAAAQANKENSVLWVRWFY